MYVQVFNISKYSLVMQRVNSICLEIISLLNTCKRFSGFNMLNKVHFLIILK